jgi:outer membrane protein TolC
MTTLSRLTRVPLLAAVALAVGGCVLSPPGQRQERDRLTAAAEPYRQPAERRPPLPELPSPATWRDVLSRALLANGDLEAGYFDWAAAYHRIDQRAGYPNTKLAPQFGYMFGGERMKSWDRTTVTVGFDPAVPLMFPGKVAKDGEMALADARAAAERFRAKKFEVQAKVLQLYADLVAQRESVRIHHETLGLLRLTVDSAARRLEAGGGSHAEVLRAQTALATETNEHRAMAAEADMTAAMLNGMLARDPRAPIDVPPGPPAARPLAASDDALIAAATDANPRLRELAHELSGRADALELARMEYIPDVNPMVGVTGGVSQMVQAMVMLPTTLPQIRARIAENRALLAGTRAMLRQSRSDKAAAFVAALYALRNAERESALLRDEVLPKARASFDAVRQSYASGAAGFTDLIDAQRMLLDVQLMQTEAAAEREKRLAELEELAGVDVETLAAPPATRPSVATAAPAGELNP